MSDLQTEAEAGSGGRRSMRALGRQLGVSDTAVRKAFWGGRFARSMRLENGRPVVVDFDLACEEWSASSRSGTGILCKLDGSHSSHGSQLGVLVPAATLAEAQRLATLQRERKDRLANDYREGRLIDVGKAAKEAFEAARIIRETLANLPARLAGELAAETDAGRIYLALDRALREALNTTSDALMASVNA